ncbi:MAG: hypothetical protein RMN25_10025 [Anaerolineae bacterium]|nr:hypothetical protein [Thermoflexales bacterium]MDW8408106.1 hypothetical protein [Anaerolineae bacterium]
MSLGDHLRFLRAMRGGVQSSGMSEADRRKVRELELRYRDTSDDELVHRLADYYGVPVEELMWHRARSRRSLSDYLLAVHSQNRPAELRLRCGEVLTGRVLWWDLAAIGLCVAEDRPLVVVQRHAVIDWPLTG